MSSIENLNVTFIEYQIPPLRNGEYTLKVGQNTSISTGTEGAGSYKKNATFIVQGNRFSLKDDIDFIYPPHRLEGMFDGHIPHTTFKRNTLPWENSSVKENCDDTEAKAPWLAILLVNNDESPPTLQNLTAAHLIAVDQGGQLPKTHYSTISNLEYGESLIDNCTVIDMPLDQFWRIAPAKEDMVYLAHIRKTSTANCVDQDCEETSCSVLLSNRIPKIGIPVHCYLVSLEGAADQLLPNSEGSSSHPDPEKNIVRLIVYRYWTFTANTRQQMLRELLENVNKGQLESMLKFRLHCLFDGTVPDQTLVTEAYNHLEQGTFSATDAQVFTRNQLHMGFMPMNHHLRSGGHTVSWYRGPLVPEPVPIVIDAPILPFATADKASQFDVKTGMFDMSYSSAWQLGQLLTLRNRTLASSMYNWRKELRRSWMLNEEQGRFGNQSEELGNFYVQIRRSRGEVVQPNIPEDILEWLSRLSLLHEVPFHYLIPDLRMLPPESLRWFNLDLNWIHSLLDGAFSIGRNTPKELHLDSDILPQLLLDIKKEGKTVRKNARIETSFFNSTDSISGFILRSEAVAGWKKLEAFGFADLHDENLQLPILRMSHLADDILFCLFDGDMKKLVIQEPPGELHTGLKLEADGRYTTRMRRLQAGTDSGISYEPGEEFGTPVTIPLRADNLTIKVEAAAKEIAQQLINAGQPLQTGFTSAHYMVETIKGGVKVPYHNK